jgi:tetrapyrrole methylase family protein/MazG family protein
VLSNWDKIKNDEKSRESVTDRLRAVPPMLPALMRAAKVGKRASCFDFENAEDVIAKVCEEIEEVREAVVVGDKTSIDEEIGDLLLTVTSLARKVGVDPEASLNRATVKFINRFEIVENEVVREGKDIKSISMTELDKIWEKIK